MLIDGTVDIRVYKKDIRFVMSANYTNLNSSYTHHIIGYFRFKFTTKFNRWIYSDTIIKEISKIFKDMGFNLTDEVTNYKAIDPQEVGAGIETVIMDLNTEDLYEKPWYNR